MALLALGYLLLSKLWSQAFVRSSDAPDARLRARLKYLVPAGLVLVFALHGASAFKVLVILFANYQLSRIELGHRTLLICIWTFNIAILFANKAYDGYRFGDLLTILAFLVCLSRSFVLNLSKRVVIGSSSFQWSNAALVYSIQYHHFESAFVFSRLSRFACNLVLRGWFRAEIDFID